MDGDPVLDEVDVQGVVKWARATVERRAKRIRVGREDDAGYVLGIIRRDFCQVGPERRGQIGRLTVVLPEKAQDHRSTGALAGELHRLLDHLRPADPRGHAGDASRGELDQTLRERERWEARHVVSDLQPVPLHRLEGGREDLFGVRTQRDHAPARNVISERVSVDINERPLRLVIEHEWNVLVVGHRSVEQPVPLGQLAPAGRTRQGRADLRIRDQVRKSGARSHPLASRGNG